MNNEDLRKVQLVQLEIAKEVKRVCDDNNIKYFLTAGTLLGAVRHRGFIPWDDDLDIGMLRKDYDEFCKIAPKHLNSKYYFQTWDTPLYPFPFGKVRKKGTIFIESKANTSMDVGIYVDILVYNDASEEEKKYKRNLFKLLSLSRLMLMKCHFQPWKEQDKVIFKKRLGYIPYQIISKFVSKDLIKKSFMKVVYSVSSSKFVHGQITNMNIKQMKKEWFESTIDATFEDSLFRIPAGYKEYLTLCYGDYMQLPPIEQRGNRHQIVKLDFGEN